MLFRSINNWIQDDLNVIEMILKVFFLSCPRIFLQPIKLLRYRGFKFFTLFLGTKCFKSLVFIVFFQWIKGWLKVISYFGFFLQIVFVFLIFVNNLFETLNFFLSIFPVFCESMTNLNKGFFVLNLKVVNSLLNISCTLPCFLSFFLFISSIILLSFILSRAVFSIIFRRTFTLLSLGLTIS